MKIMKIMSTMIISKKKIILIFKMIKKNIYNCQMQIILMTLIQKAIKYYIIKMKYITILLMILIYNYLSSINYSVIILIINEIFKEF